MDVSFVSFSVVIIYGCVICGVFSCNFILMRNLWRFDLFFNSLLMEAEHKDILRKHQVKLVESMMMDSNLLDYLKEQRVLTASMDEDIRAQKPLRNQARELLQVLPKRGPNAFGHFLCCLQLSGHEHLARSLYNACRTPPTLLIEQYEDQYKRPLLELCGTRVSGVQSGTTLPASSATLPSQSQLPNGSGIAYQVSGTLADYNVTDACTMILNLSLKIAVPTNKLVTAFSQLGHAIQPPQPNLNAMYPSNIIRGFMESAKSSLVCVVVLVHGDALNDETPVFDGATSVGDLKAAFYQAARSPNLANKPKFLLQIGFVSFGDQMSTDGTDAVRVLHGQAGSANAKVPLFSGNTGSSQGTSDTRITPSGADCFVLQVNLPAGDVKALDTLYNILTADDTVSEIARKIRSQFPSFEETSSRGNLRLKCPTAASLIDDRRSVHHAWGDAVNSTSMSSYQPSDAS